MQTSVYQCDGLRQQGGSLIREIYNRFLARLTRLAPDIVEAILRGNEPEGISLRKLQKDLPVCWQEQRERWRGNP